MATMAKAVSDVETKYHIEFKTYQKTAIESVVNGKDTFVVLPTGYGKSYIYSFLPEVFNGVLGQTDSSLLVISPLQSLMVDQVRALTDFGIKATFVGEMQNDSNVDTEIEKGHFSIVFASPEAVLTSTRWRRVLTRGRFQQTLKAVAVDEAHCITQWGADFRQEYARLNEIRSVIASDTPFLALTATATEGMRKEIFKSLQMSSDSTTVAIIPERTNIRYTFQKVKKDIGQNLYWLVQELLSKSDPCKAIIYCRNIASCADLYEHFMLALGDKAFTSKEKTLQSRVVGMFHRSTSDANKTHILETFVKADSQLRVVFATIAFGMGVNIPDVDIVVHWGAPRGVEQFAQESGRAGRDGRQADSIVYYNGYDLRSGSSTKEVRALCTGDTCSPGALCYRRYLFLGIAALVPSSHEMLSLLYPEAGKLSAVVYDRELMESADYAEFLRHLYHTLI
ncbi:PREDICTED: ATP-dependent DNA helicase Q-like SIM [Priapulus caudatus]|uniref:DNA 3'-5' helicase n=1 Tax=Priapulus caudatus TaxID=37621 RepID=A0ABM1EBC1_PRICU|nr:PREDICTED: ATP-dependent DNA helicase Q-like SIM [Priapulus caudatus]